jgi:hypothetical protein
MSAGDWPAGFTRNSTTNSPPRSPEPRISRRDPPSIPSKLIEVEQLHPCNMGIKENHVNDAEPGRAERDFSYRRTPAVPVDQIPPQSPTTGSIVIVVPGEHTKRRVATQCVRGHGPGVNPDPITKDWRLRGMDNTRLAVKAVCRLAHAVRVAGVVEPSVQCVARLRQVGAVAVHPRLGRSAESHAAHRPHVIVGNGCWAHDHRARVRGVVAAVVRLQSVRPLVATDARVLFANHPAVVVGAIHRVTHTELAKVVPAGQGLRSDLRRGKRGQQHRRQNGNDGDDHQQLDQGEGPPASWPETALRPAAQAYDATRKASEPPLQLIDFKVH